MNRHEHFAVCFRRLLPKNPKTFGKNNAKQGVLIVHRGIKKMGLGFAESFRSGHDVDFVNGSVATEFGYVRNQEQQKL